jgi:hypothetical protein
MDLAVGSYEQRRRLAQRMLSPAPGLDAAIAARLTQGKPQQRIHITTWLGKRAATQQVAAVHQALAGEKALPVRAALLSTLQQLGGDLSPYFDPDALRAEADEGLKKNPTAGLDSKAPLILDCGGGRRYHARLNADHKLVLSNPACKPG